MHPAHRLLLRAPWWLAVVLVAAQLIHVLGWVTDPNYCDFPDACINVAYPQAYHAARVLFWMSLGAGVLACAVAVVSRSGLPSILRLAAAAAVGCVGYLVSPFAPMNAAAWTHARAPIDLDGAWVCMLIFVVALVVYGWDVVSRHHATHSRGDLPEHSVDLPRGMSTESAAR